MTLYMNQATLFDTERKREKEKEKERQINRERRERKRGDRNALLRY